MIEFVADCVSGLICGLIGYWAGRENHRVRVVIKPPEKVSTFTVKQGDNEIVQRISRN